MHSYHHTVTHTHTLLSSCTHTITLSHTHTHSYPRTITQLQYHSHILTPSPSHTHTLTPHTHSAGVGRSGTVIAIDYCLQQVESTGSLDICGYVSRMREQRNYMVQTEQQYTFTHYAILEAITYGNTSCVLTEFRKCLERLQQVNGESGQTLLSEEFDRLGTVKTMVKKSSFQQRIKRKGAPPRHFDSSCEWEWFSSTHTHRVACKFHPKKTTSTFGTCTCTVSQMG